MKLLDTSIWIEFLRRAGNPDVKRYVANLIASSDAAYTCPIRFEVIAGAFDPEIPSILRAFSFAARYELTSSDWDLSGEAARKLRKAGIKVPAADLLIATVARERGLPLVCRDPHFDLIQQTCFQDLVVEKM